MNEPLLSQLMDAQADLLSKIQELEQIVEELERSGGSTPTQIQQAEKIDRGAEEHKSGVEATDAGGIVAEGPSPIGAAPSLDTTDESKASDTHTAET